MENKEQINLVISSLLENVWITKKEHPDEFMFFKQNRKDIQKFFNDNFGYQLFVTPTLVKLEKVPYEAESWMGIQDFKEPMDYSIFMAILAYLEDKAGDDLFLISMLGDAVKNFFTNEVKIHWELHKHRLSFVRAMKHVEKLKLVDVIEGELGSYEKDQEREVLYKPTMLSKYYMRFFTKPVKEFQSREEMLLDKWKNLGTENTPRENLQSLNRRLFFSPVVYRDELSDSEKKYFNYQSYRMAENISEFTDFELEIYRNEILLIAKSKNSSKEQHPNAKAVSDIVLQFGALVKSKFDELEEEERPDFYIEILKSEFNNWVEELCDKQKHGWTQEFREKSTSDEVARKLLDYLVEWKLAKEDHQTYTVILYPTITRLVGDYPDDYKFQRFILEKFRRISENLAAEDEIIVTFEDFEKNWLDSFNNTEANFTFDMKLAKEVVSKYCEIDDENNRFLVVSDKIPAK